MGMPSLLSATVIAGECNLNPALVNRIVGVCILVSLATSGLWFFVEKALLQNEIRRGIPSGCLSFVPQPVAPKVRR